MRSTSSRFFGNTETTALEMWMMSSAVMMYRRACGAQRDGVARTNPDAVATSGAGVINNDGFGRQSEAGTETNG